MNDDAYIKPLADVLKPDVRQSFFVIVDFETGKTTKRDLKYFHNSIDGIEVSDYVPENIRVEISKAKNVLLFSWFQYSMSTVATLQIYTTLEFALKEKFKLEEGREPSRSGMKRLLKTVFQKGWLDIDKLYERIVVDKQYQEYRSKRGDYLRVILDFIPNMRNYMAHGSSQILPPGYAFRTLGIVIETINQLYGNDV